MTDLTGDTDVPAAYRWASNAELIADVAKLWLRKDMVTLDPTYGRGAWWRLWRPDSLSTHDVRKDGVDFRHLPEADNTFDLVAWDPPYVSVGGRSTSTIGEFNDRFGLADAPKDPASLQAYNNAGFAQVVRVVKPRGLVLAKCMDYVSSGRLQPGTFWTWQAAEALGLELVDRFDHLTTSRQQPAGRTRKPTAAEVKAGVSTDTRVGTVQYHARRRPSVLFVFRKRRPARLASARPPSEPDRDLVSDMDPVVAMPWV